MKLHYTFFELDMRPESSRSDISNMEELRAYIIKNKSNRGKSGNFSQ